jgi:general secretion pathway protein D
MKYALFIAGLLSLTLVGSVRAQGVPGLPPGLPGASGSTASKGEGLKQTKEGIELDFNAEDITIVLRAYKELTGKTLIMDSAIAPNTATLTLKTNGVVTQEEAVRLIEAVLLLNNFTLVPGPDNTIKVLSSAKPPTTEGIPLYTSARELPEGDQVISFYLPLRYIETQDALTILQQAVGTHAYGKIVAAQNAQALIIADTTPVIRQAIRIIELIDVPPAQLSTEFIQLQRADAEEVVEALKEIVQQYTQGSTTQAQRQSNRNQPNIPLPVPVNQGTQSGSSNQDLTQVLTGSQFYADKRTNRILVITRPLYFTQIKDLILKFDDAVSLNAPYVRDLQYVRAAEILPVLADLLKSDSETQVEITEGEQSQTGTRGNTGGSRGGSGGSGISRADLLGDPDEDTSPSSAIVGKTRLVADKRNNSILVFGPPEDIDKTRVLLDQLDQRPRQIYLSTVIGSLTLQDGWELSVNLLQKLVGSGDNDVASANFPGAAPSSPGALPIFDPRSLFGAAPGNFANMAAGLSIYGAVGSTLDYFVNALEDTNRFKTISRPSIFTENNKKATILSGERVAVPTSTLTNTGVGAGSDATFRTNIDFEEVVLKLEVIPLITPDGEVNLEIAQVNDTIQGFDVIDGNEIPRIATQEVTTTVTVPDRATIVLGGLVVEDQDRAQSGVPWLSRIPVLGYLFSSTTKSAERSELVILIQPTVLNDNEALENQAQETYDQTLVAPSAYAAANEQEYSGKDPEDLRKKKYRYMDIKPLEDQKEDEEVAEAARTNRSMRESLATKPNRARSVQERVGPKAPPSWEGDFPEARSESGPAEDDPFLEFLRDRENSGEPLAPQSLEIGQ